MNKKKMEYKSFTAQIMEAERLTGSKVHDLPRGHPLDAYYVDEFLEPKGNWMKGPGVFVVPVRPNKGLWFDWTANDELNTAVVPTVKGCNPITGLQTSGFHLEQYESKCPKHGCDFVGERFCSECGYKWPERNYNSQHPLWWDGFRAEDGTVRQFYFTSDQNLDIAPRLIGKENTIPAFGFAFYSPKEVRRPEGEFRSRGISASSMSAFDTQSMVFYSDSLGFSFDTNVNAPEVKCTSSANYNAPKIMSAGGHLPIMSSSSFKKCSQNIKPSMSIKPEKKKLAEVSIGAGARIRQSLNKDPYPLESWKEIPDAVMTIYFIFHSEFEKLRAKGMRDLRGNKEGMLSGLPVG